MTTKPAGKLRAGDMVMWFNSRESRMIPHQVTDLQIRGGFVFMEIKLPDRGGGYVWRGTLDSEVTMAPKEEL